LTQSLQEQVSHVQIQQSRILELLGPLHPTLQSVPLHINLARNAILEKIPEGCPCTNDRSGGLIPSTQPSCQTLSSQESAEPPLKVRKRMRTNLDGQNFDPHDPAVNRYEDQPIAVEERQILHRPARTPGEILTSSRPQRIGTHCGVQTPSGGMNGIGGVIHNHLRNTSPVSGNAALASRLSAVPRGTAPSFILISQSEHGSRIVRQRKNSNSSEGEFAFTIRGYMTTSCHAGPCYDSPGEEIHLV
jgi:hypothetical protein